MSRPHKPMMWMYQLLLKYPVVLLVRRIEYGKPVWLLWNTFRTEIEAAVEYDRHIHGCGVTAWAWWGDTAAALKMLKEDEENAEEGTR